MKTTFDLVGYSLNPRALILRGVLSILFGALALAWPGPGLLAIAALYGIYALVDGVFSIACGVRRGRRHQSWGLPILEGFLGITAGVVTLLWPGVTLLVLSILVGAWALVTGVLEIATALKLSRSAPEASRRGRVLFGLVGIFSVILGIAIFVSPPLGAITLLTVVASYALISGILMLALGAQLRRVEKVMVEALPMDRAA